MKCIDVELEKLLAEYDINKEFVLEVTETALS